MSEINDNQAFGKPTQALMKYYIASDLAKTSLSLNKKDQLTLSSHSSSENLSQNSYGKQPLNLTNKVIFSLISTSCSSESLSSGSADDHTTGACFSPEQTKTENLAQKASETKEKKKKKCLRKVSYKKKFKTEVR